MSGRSRDPLARRRRAGRDLARSGHLFPRLPRQPVELADCGLCTRHPRPELWSASNHAERQAAISVCQRCPVVSICQEWSLALPDTDLTIYGGLTTSQRIQAKRERNRAAG